MFDFLLGGGCLVGGIYLIEYHSLNSVAMSGVAGLLMLFGVYRLIMMLLDSGR